MHFTLLTTLLSASSALASASAPKPLCAQSELPTPQKRTLESHIARNTHRRHTLRQTAPSPISVNLYQHVLAFNTTPAGGYLSRETMDTQYQILRDSFAPYAINLTLADTLWYANATLAHINRDGGFENDVRAALRKGSFADLNLFYVADLESGPGNSATGWCTWPWGPSNATWDPEETEPPVPDERYDGCFVHALTTPDLGGERPERGFFEVYEEGKIAVHEAGHWFGLFHVFEGGCEGPGDYVNDTAPQGGYTFTIDGVCEDVRPGCFLGEELPNYENHMDYSDDKCRVEFTEGQMQRMHSLWYLYRGPYKSDSSTAGASK